MEINTITDSTWYLGGTQRSPSSKEESGRNPFLLKSLQRLWGESSITLAILIPQFFNTCLYTARHYVTL